MSNPKPMLRKSFGNIEILLTDADFGHVVPGDPTFDERLKERDLEIFPTVWMDQQHTNTVQFAEEPGVLAATDGVITNEPNLRLVTKTADCVPILLWNTKAHVIAALHCGWKGFVRGIIGAFGEQVMNQAALKDFQAFLGPHLRMPNFEVQQDFVDALPEAKRAYLVNQDGKKYFDITRGVLEELKGLGIEQVEDCGVDTYRNPDYFSYRTWTQTPKDQRPANYSTFSSSIVMRS